MNTALKQELTDLLPLPITRSDENFKNHLDEHSNHRILFSSKFGTGKTYFLKEFFRKYSDDYVSVHLFPCRYLIGSDRDILNLIKHDILLELSRIKNKAEKCSLEDFIKFIGENFFEDIKNIGMSSSIIIRAVLEDVPLLGKIFKEETIDEIITKIDLASKTEDEIRINTIRTQLDDLINYNLVNSALGEILQMYATKKTVLIIDDLDRLDPPNIFRIFNIFGALLDPDDNSNLLGFHQIVFVCDIANIENIYKHVYGEHSDFSGYIEKFFSNRRFFFNNKTALTHHIETELYKQDFIVSLPDNVPYSKGDKIYEQYNPKEYIVDLLVSILRFMNHSEEILSFRKISKPYLTKVHESKLIYEIKNEDTIIPVLYVLHSLIAIFGDSKQMLDALTIARDQANSRPVRYQVFSNKSQLWLTLSQLLTLKQNDSDINRIKIEKQIISEDGGPSKIFINAYGEGVDQIMSDQESSKKVFEKLHYVVSIMINNNEL